MVADRKKKKAEKTKIEKKKVEQTLIGQLAQVNKEAVRISKFVPEFTVEY